MLTVDDLIQHCPRCCHFHPRRWTCAEARLDRETWREEQEKRAARVLNEAFNNPAFSQARPDKPEET